MKRKVIDLNQSEKDARAFLQEIEQKKKAASEILYDQLPQAKTVVLDCIIKLDQLSVAEDYTATLHHLTAARGEEGTRLPYIRKVLPDQIKLDDARRALGSRAYQVDEGDQKVEKQGRGWIEERADGNTVVVYITEAGKAALNQETAKAA